MWRDLIKHLGRVYQLGGQPEMALFKDSERDRLVMEGLIYPHPSKPSLCGVGHHPQAESGCWVAGFHPAGPA
jgi:hypothetical protein